jgi:hypothetical protein
MAAFASVNCEKLLCDNSVYDIHDFRKQLLKLKIELTKKYPNTSFDTHDEYVNFIKCKPEEYLSKDQCDKFKGPEPKPKIDNLSRTKKQSPRSNSKSRKNSHSNNSISPVYTYQTRETPNIPSTENPIASQKQEQIRIEQEKRRIEKYKTDFKSIMDRQEIDTTRNERIRMYFLVNVHPQDITPFINQLSKDQKDIIAKAFPFPYYKNLSIDKKMFQIMYDLANIDRPSIVSNEKIKALYKLITQDIRVSPIAKPKNVGRTLRKSLSVVAQQVLGIHSKTHAKRIQRTQRLQQICKDGKICHLRSSSR